MIDYFLVLILYLYPPPHLPPLSPPTPPGGHLSLSNFSFYLFLCLLVKHMNSLLHSNLKNPYRWGQVSRSPSSEQKAWLQVQEYVVDTEDTTPILHVHCQRWPLITAATGRHITFPLSPPGSPLPVPSILHWRKFPSWRREAVPQFPPPVVGSYDITSLDKHVAKSQDLTWALSLSHPHPLWEATGWSKEAVNSLRTSGRGGRGYEHVLRA